MGPAASVPYFAHTTPWKGGWSPSRRSASTSHARAGCRVCRRARRPGRQSAAPSRHGRRAGRRRRGHDAVSGSGVRRRRSARRRAAAVRPAAVGRDADDAASRGRCAGSRGRRGHPSRHAAPARHPDCRRRRRARDRSRRRAGADAVGLRVPVRRPYSAPERVAATNGAGRPTSTRSAPSPTSCITGRRGAGPGRPESGAGRRCPAADVDDVLARALARSPRRESIRRPPIWWMRSPAAADGGRSGRQRKKPAHDRAAAAARRRPSPRLPLESTMATAGVVPSRTLVRRAAGANCAPPTIAEDEIDRGSPAHRRADGAGARRSRPTTSEPTAPRFALARRAALTRCTFSRRAVVRRTPTEPSRRRRRRRRRRPRWPTPTLVPPPAASRAPALPAAGHGAGCRRRRRALAGATGRRFARRRDRRAPPARHRRRSRRRRCGWRSRGDRRAHLPSPAATPRQRRPHRRRPRRRAAARRDAAGCRAHAGAAAPGRLVVRSTRRRACAWTAACAAARRWCCATCRCVSSASRIEREGFKPDERRVALSAAQPTVTVERGWPPARRRLRRRRPASLVIESRPAGATVFVDGRRGRDDADVAADSRRARTASGWRWRGSTPG